jgi:hypothetical protein
MNRLLLSVLLVILGLVIVSFPVVVIGFSLVILCFIVIRCPITAGEVRNLSSFMGSSRQESSTIQKSSRLCRYKMSIGSSQRTRC